MNFTSFHFLIFFFITLFIGHLLRNKTRKLRIFLLLASYYFYGVFKPEYLFLILLSTLYDYIAALGIESYRKKKHKNLFYKYLSYIPDKIWLNISLFLNLSLLGFFKYTNFGLEVINDTTGLKHTIFYLTPLDIILPVGISFYTFQSLSYTIDVYRGILKARDNFIDFALYVSFFPQLVAGPIVRATTFFKQMEYPKKITFEDYKIGFARIITGFFRKLVLADNLAPLVNTVFANPENYHFIDLWLASLGFGWQIYFDFAGYTDIARGVARFFGYEFEINFAYPMAARNITEHWKRWHISLTTWLRDYLYIPLGGSRVSPGRVYFNIFIVWLATGIWHGAAYHFIAWGLWQYVMIVIHRNYDGSKLQSYLHTKIPRLWEVIARIILFFSLNFGFIWFRAENLEKANFIIGRLFGFDNINKSLSFVSDYPKLLYHDYIMFLILLWFYEFYMDKKKLDYFIKDNQKLILLLSIMVFMILIFASPDTPNFLYFQF
ncbi:MAG: membrane-bound O-acyltransferase family protein [Leptospiraceae bacterium]|nr:MAG: membrane-bound O-acyltransferase family protein [Leptospiraceae bacterium]